MNRPIPSHVASIGGANGMKLTRAAFAVILKYSETVTKLMSALAELDVVLITVDSKLTGVSRIKALVSDLAESRDF